MAKCFMLVVVTLVVTVALALPSRAADKKGEGGYAGPEACAGCHESQAKTITKDIHWKKAIKDSPVNEQGCESCHGPGATHAEKGGGKGVGGLLSFAKEESAGKKAAACLSCHESTPRMANWDSGAHKRNKVSCSDCHVSHGGGFKAKEPELCLSCHRDLRIQINKQAHHPILEGKVKCTDCHDPHGGPGPKMVKADSVNDLCYKCHTEKRGPYAFEHPPVSENCTICHAPHGSNHNNLLTSKPPYLCQACHSDSGHNNRPLNVEHGFQGNATNNKYKFYARGCVNCHSNIHGSNGSDIFLR